LKQKTSPETEFSNGITVAAAGEEASEENSVFASLSASLAEIRKLKGVTGYILRSDTSALIDVADSDKIFQFAILTSEIHESSIEMAKQFNLGEPESVLLEGENIKVLCLRMDDNKIDVFMEKSANHVWIIKRILL
jgi:predicted regulator of Ras-like GTPase activity (Roadblock/LC7/MglB family)